MSNVSWVCESGRFQLIFHTEDVEHVCKLGPNDEYLEDIIRIPRIRNQIIWMDPEVLYGILAEYGGWDDDELTNHDQNLRRLLWIAIWDCKNRR